jgi:Ca2+-dependent lipid-binding protein
MQAPDREVTFVEVVVHQAKELPVMDTNATASPYVILWREGAEKEKHKSKVIKKELNPRVRK